MPIDLTWRHMIQSMKDQYKEGEEDCRDFKDGSKICASKKAWSVFFATLRSKGWDETKPASNLALNPEDVKAITPKVFATPQSGLIITMDHAVLIHKGKKKAIVKTIKLSEHIDEWVYLISDGVCFGEIKLKEPIEIKDQKEFEQSKNEHLISNAEKEQWSKKEPSWGKFPLYLYEFEYQAYDRPKPIKLKERGPQVFVNKDNIEFLDIKNLRFQDLEYYHAFAHSRVEELGDVMCKLHFDIASEMIDKGIPHLRRTLCDGIVQLIHSWKTYDPSKISDEVLRDDWRICKAWLSTLRTSKKPFTSPQFEGMKLNEQISKIKKMARSIRDEMIKRGWHPKELTKFPDNVQDIDVPFINNLTNKQLEECWKYLHDKWKQDFPDERVTEDYLNAAIFIQIERYKRGLIDVDYKDKDKLDEEARYSWQEYPSPPTGPLSEVEQPLADEPEELTLEQVISLFRNLGIIPIKGQPFAGYLVGRLVNEGKIERSHDIDIVLRQEPDPRILIALGNIQPRWLADKIHVVFDPAGPGIGNSVPLFGYALNPLPKELNIKGFGPYRSLASEVKLFKYIIGLKPKSGFGTNEFFDIDDLWNKWASQYIDQDIIVQEKVDGRRMQAHVSKDKVELITEDTQRNRADKFPEIVNELKKLGKECILDGEFLVYDFQGKEVKGSGRHKREIGDLVPREDTAVITTGTPDDEFRKRIVYVFYDIMFLNGETLTDKSTSERYDILRKTIPESSEYLDVVRGDTASSKAQFYKLVEKYRRVNGSEGVVCKASDSIYPVKYSGENRTGEFAKMKNLKEAEFIVLDITSKKEQKTGKAIDTWMYSCVKPNEIILGDNREIQDLSLLQAIGKGNLNKITKRYQRSFNGNLHRIIAKGVLPVSLTPEHPLLVAMIKKSDSNSKSKIISTKWKPAKDITSSDYVCIPKLKSKVQSEVFLDKPLKYSHNFKKIDQIPINEETSWLFGIYLAEGFSKRQVNLAFGPLEMDLARKVQTLIGKYFPHKVTLMKIPSGIKIYFGGSRIARFFINNFGTRAWNKHVPDWLLFSTNQNLRQLLQGYLEGDGCKIKNGYRYSTTSKVLALQLQLIAAKLGYLLGVNLKKNRTTEILGREVNCHPGYQGGIYFDGKIKQIQNEDYLAVKVRKNELEPYNGDVYNLETLDNTYLISNILVHNCGFEVPKDKVDEFSKDKIVERNGHYYQVIGKAYGTSVRCKIGDIVTVMPIRIRKYEDKEGKIFYTWMFPFFKELRQGKTSPDTLTAIERIAKVGTAPLSEELTDDKIILKLDLCKYYKDKDICPLMKRHYPETDRYKLAILEEEVLKYPIMCPLAKHFKCRYLKSYYYGTKVTKYDASLSEPISNDFYESDELIDFAKFPGHIKQELQAKYMECPTGEHDYVMQSHIRGKSQHLDFRMSVNGYLVGWSVVGGNIEEPVDPEELLTRFKKEEKGFRAEEKARQPKEWLKVQGEAKPGEVGGGTEVGGMFKILSSGKVIFGAQKPYFHEYFIKGKGFDDWTRIVVRAINVARLEPETKVKLPSKELMWRLLVTKDLEPYTISDRAIKKGWRPPRGNKEPFPMPWTKNKFPEQYQKWKDYIGSKELSQNISYTYSQHSFRGPKHVRYMWVRTYYLMLEQDNRTRMFRMDDFAPIEREVAAVDEGLESKKYMSFEGITEPNSRFNPNKELKGEMKILSKGSVNVTEDETGNLVLKFNSGLLKGTWKLEQEEKGSDIWTLYSTELSDFHTGKFVYHKHIVEDKEHYDIRFQKKDNEPVHEFNLFTDIRKGPSVAIYKTCYDPSWMDIKEKEHRKVGGIDTIVEPIDSGDVKFIEENPDFLSFELKGKTLKGLYIAKKQAEGKWIFQKTQIARTSPINILPDGSAFFTAVIDTKKK